MQHKIKVICARSPSSLEATVNKFLESINNEGSECKDIHFTHQYDEERRTMLHTAYITYIQNK